MNDITLADLESFMDMMELTELVIIHDTRGTSLAYNIRGTV